MSELTGDWDKVSQIFNAARIKNALYGVAAKVGNYGASEVKKGIRSGAPGGQTFQALSEFTIQRKGSSKPLIDKGDLIGSITFEVVDDDSVAIGVKKGNAGNIAAVHEYGCTIEVTPKMRAFLHYNGIHLKEATTYINIPPRPFLRPVLASKKFQKKVAEMYLNALRGAFS